MTTEIVAATLDRVPAAQAEVATWIEQRQVELTAEINEFAEAEKRGFDRHWSVAKLKRDRKRLEKHALFLEKLHDAIAAGYVIMPNLNLELLAVRTDKGPYGWHQEERHEMTADRLPPGEGEYVSPVPDFHSWKEERKRTKGEGTYSVTVYRATKNAPVDVPMVLMKKSDLADALQAALGERLFDEIGLVKDGARDPFLVGRILHPRARGYDRRGVSFFIGWWFDPKILNP